MTIIKIFQVTFKFCDIADQRHGVFFSLSVFKYESKSADILELYLSTFDQ